MTDWGDKKDKIQKQTDADIFQRFNIFYPQLWSLYEAYSRYAGTQHVLHQRLGPTCSLCTYNPVAKTKQSSQATLRSDQQLVVLQTIIHNIGRESIWTKLNLNNKRASCSPNSQWCEVLTVNTCKLHKLHSGSSSSPHDSSHGLGYGGISESLSGGVFLCFCLFLPRISWWWVD